MAVMGTDGEDKRKHLEFLQGVVNRMASNSFLFKGWSITIIAGISAFAAKDSAPGLMAVPIVSTLLFWSIDAHYLMLERAFRNLYDEVASRPTNTIDFSMKPQGISVLSWTKTLVGRPILWLFYGTVLIMLVLLTFIINGYGLEVRFIHGT
jgi:hypothetical protein